MAELLKGQLAGLKVDVRPVMCFVGEARIGRSSIGNVDLLQGDELVDFLRSLPSRLDSHEIDAVVRHLLALFPPRGPKRPDGTELIEPAEPVYFLHPWKKAGKNRLYAKGSDGRDLGYLDLITGQTQCPDANTGAALNRLLPHYLNGGIPGDAANVRSDAEKKGIRRFLASIVSPRHGPPEPPIIAGFHWRGHGKSRLYVSRLDSAGARTELGWFDLERRLLQCRRAGCHRGCDLLRPALHGISKRRHSKNQMSLDDPASTDLEATPLSGPAATGVLAGC